MLAGIAAMTMGITACGSIGSTTTTTAATAVAPIPTSYMDKNGFPYAPGQASGGSCPEDPAFPSTRCKLRPASGADASCAARSVHSGPGTIALDNCARCRTIDAIRLLSAK